MCRPDCTADVKNQRTRYAVERLLSIYTFFIKPWKCSNGWTLNIDHVENKQDFHFWKTGHPNDSSHFVTEYYSNLCHRFRLSFNQWVMFFLDLMPYRNQSHSSCNKLGYHRWTDVAYKVVYNLIIKYRKALFPCVCACVCVRLHSWTPICIWTLTQPGVLRWNMNPKKSRHAVTAGRPVNKPTAVGAVCVLLGSQKEMELPACISMTFFFIPLLLPCFLLGTYWCLRRTRCRAVLHRHSVSATAFYCLYKYVYASLRLSARDGSERSAR